jgi:hypothetical protein
MVLGLFFFVSCVNEIVVFITLHCSKLQLFVCYGFTLIPRIEPSVTAMKLVGYGQVGRCGYDSNVFFGSRIGGTVRIEKGTTI